MPRLRGAFPSPRYRLAAAMPHRIVGPTPSQFIWLPDRLDIWDNDVDGDCVTADEAAAKGTGPHAVFITPATVVAWATANNVLNGADLTQVMDLMRNGGFLQDGVLYNDGPYSAVDWTNSFALQNAISQGPVKIGVAADQLDSAVGTDDPPPSGWFASGFTADDNEDHCTGLFGFGPTAWLASQIAAKYKVAITVPTGFAATALALFTWGSIGIIDMPSMLAITGEAWLRNPGTVIAPVPVPGS
jgi:hypothetical protein